MATPTSDIGALARNIQPLRAQVYGPERAMTERAHRLEDSAVEDVGADRDRRVEPEREDEQRRHQRAAAHAGEADERPDQEPRERELPGHLRRRLRRRPSGRAGFARASV